MKKIYFTALLIAVFGQLQAQILNQSAGWPNAAWTITGSYNADPMAFEANPTTTANFAYDDDDAGNSTHEDNIAAESPVINLTAAFNGNEKAVKITFDYSYYYLDYDQLQFQYWDASASSWVAWPGGTLAGTQEEIVNDFCGAPKIAAATGELSIAGFNATQLSGFKYRISYDDDPLDSDWNYGFCFNSPTIVSVSCGAPTAGTADVTSATTATLTWTVGGSADAEVAIVLAGTGVPAAANDTGENVNGTTYAATDLTAQTAYEFYVRTECVIGTGFSSWAGPFAFNTTIAPGCSSPVTPANGATNVPVGDVTFEWSAPTTGDPATSYDMYYGETPGDVTNYVGNFEENSALITLTGYDFTFYWRIVPINAGGEAIGCDGDAWSFTTESAPAPPANDDCAGALELIPAGDFASGVILTTNAGATDAGEITPDCQGNVDASVWYTVVVPDSGTLTLQTQAADGSPLIDTIIEVYSGTCAALVAVDCNDDDDNGLFSTLELTEGITAGQTLYVAVYRYGSSSGIAGPFQLAAYDASLLATNNFKNGTFAAYPNPVIDVLNLSYTKEISDVAVYNMLGQQVYAKSLNAKNAQIDLSFLNSGNYVVKLTSDNEVQTLKVLKQ